MKAKVPSMVLLLFLVNLGIGEMHLADLVPQYLDDRANFIGGISLFALTPNTGVDGACPSYAPACPGTCCPDGCCPTGTICTSIGNFCCPTNVDCSSLVDAAPFCANSSWHLYARPQGATSLYFCCEADQVGILPNQCVPKSGTIDASQLAPTVVPGVGLATGGSTISSQGGSTNTATAKGTGQAGSPATGSPITTSTGLTTATTSASSTAATTKSSATKGFVAGDWPIGVGIHILAAAFGMHLIA